MRDLPYPELRHALDYKPPSLFPSPEFEPLQLVAPHSFYDKHLDESLVLKKVVAWPTLFADLSLAVDRALRSLKDESITLPSIRRDDMIPMHDWLGERYTKPIRDGESVAKAYQTTTSHFCGVLASTLLLSPRAPQWQLLLMWDLTLEKMLDDYKPVEEDFVLRLDENTGVDFDWEFVEVANQSALRYALKKSPELAHWEITAVCPEGEQLLRDMGEVVKGSDFLHEKCSTIGSLPHNVILPYTPDAVTTAWDIPISSFGEKRHDNKLTLQPSLHLPIPPGRRSARTNTKSSDGATNSKRKSGSKAPKINMSIDSEMDARWSSITLPGRFVEEGIRERSVVHSFLQRAWARSVRMDSTFMVFHCGKYERIGFRHRTSQTLFLSDLVDVSHGEDPAYGKLHTGLYISALHDILDRAAQKMRKEAEDQPKEKKRKREPEKILGIDSKRLRTRGQALKAKATRQKRQELQKLIGTEVSTRNLALIHMRFGSYNSRAPNAFIRSGQPRPGKDATYTHSQYISLIVASKIASGATGIVHSAVLEYVLEDRRTVRNLDVAVKFAFEPPQKEKMRHEYSIYHHLAASGVEGIPKILGLFEDLENDTLALVMTHVGTALATIYGYALQFVVPQPQHAAFVDVVKKIHEAGVRHRDIRPENLMVDDDGEVYVIDFDMAQFGSTDGAKEREISHLQDLLSGKYSPPNEFPSERTRDSESSSEPSSEPSYSSETETES